jgi:hypothetical protein
MVMSVFCVSYQLYLKIYLKVKWSRWGASRLQQLSVNYCQIVQVVMICMLSLVLLHILFRNVYRITVVCGFIHMVGSFLLSPSYSRATRNKNNIPNQPTSNK